VGWARNELLVQLVVTLTGSGALMAVINAVTSRRKTRSEAVKTHAEAVKTQAEVGGVAASAAGELVDTTVALLVPLREEFGRLAARVAQQDSELAELRREVRDSRTREEAAVLHLRAYTAWAQRAAEKLSAAGIQIDPPPFPGQGKT
jgi:antitoxin (DNA-binding transcriptional repressor) of toxin-antitoxin stability system